LNSLALGQAVEGIEDNASHRSGLVDAALTTRCSATLFSDCEEIRWGTSHVQHSPLKELGRKQRAIETRYEFLGKLSGLVIADDHRLALKVDAIFKDITNLIAPKKRTLPRRLLGRRTVDDLR